MNERMNEQINTHIGLGTESHSSPFSLGYIRKGDNHKKTLPGSMM